MLDISMPGMDGYETCTAMVRDPQLASVPIIFISALDDPLDKVKAFQVGGRDYVTKPFNAEEVLARAIHHVMMGRLSAELQTQNQNLYDATLKLKEMSHLKSNFTAMLVHDIRSPLSVVSLALDAWGSGPELRDSVLPQAQKALRKVENLLGEMLEIYRTDSGELPVEFGPIDPVPFLEQVAEAHRLPAASADLRVNVIVPPGLPPVMGDPGKLERALANLLGNAIKYTPKGGAISLEAAVEHGAGVEAGLRWVKVTVTDTGRGVPAEQLPYIFDPFRQTQTGDSASGVGLGLAIVQRIVAAHRGRINVSSQMGFGSSFAVLIPA
jgi:two-component system sensor histidine kinase/response regulator